MSLLSRCRRSYSAHVCLQPTQGAKFSHYILSSSLRLLVSALSLAIKKEYVEDYTGHFTSCGRFLFCWLLRLTNRDVQADRRSDTNIKSLKLSVKVCNSDIRASKTLIVIYSSVCSENKIGKTIFKSLWLPLGKSEVFKINLSRYPSMFIYRYIGDSYAPSAEYNNLSPAYGHASIS